MAISVLQIAAFRSIDFTADLSSLLLVLLLLFFIVVVVLYYYPYCYLLLLLLLQFLHFPPFNDQTEV